MPVRCRYSRRNELRTPLASRLSSLRGASMKVIACALIVALSIGCASKPAYHASQIAWTGSNAADFHSTQRALDRGYREANPILGQSLLRIGFAKSATTVLVLWWMDAKVRDEHPK